MTNHKQSAMLISMGGVTLFIGSVTIFFAAMGILQDTAPFPDTDAELASMYVGLFLAAVGAGTLLVGVHRVVSSMGVRITEAEGIAAAGQSYSS